jgi:hypothetical protein
MQWIDITERQPENDQECIVYSPYDGIVTASYNVHKNHSYWSSTCCCIHEVESPYDVTHWMPAPSAETIERKGK